jgi:hypothetical protein
MSSFSCPHFDMEKDLCMKLRAECVPGRPGCVLRHNSEFAVPWEQRLCDKTRPIAPPVGEEYTALDSRGELK